MSVVIEETDRFVRGPTRCSTGGEEETGYSGSGEDGWLVRGRTKDSVWVGVGRKVVREREELSGFLEHEGV